MSLELLHGFAVERLYEFLPRAIARRIAPPETIAREVRIDLRPLVPIEVQFGASIAHLNICFRITNLSLVSLELDRLFYDVWFGQPTLEAQDMKPRHIERRSIEDIYLRHQLHSAQAGQIRSQANGQVIESVHVDVTAHFESKSGPVEVTARIDHRDVVCRGIEAK
jgi:hypothetical protein